MIMQAAASAPLHATAIPARSFLGEGLVLVFCLFALGVLEPKLSVVNFRNMTLQQAVDGGSANLANELKWLALASLATLAASRHLERLWTLVLAAWPLMLVLAYCLLSAVWSDYPTISIRRCFGLIIPTYCLCAALAAIDRPERIANIVYAAFWAALVCNLLALPLASAFDEAGFFRGVTGNKNTLGGMGALAILSGVAFSRRMQGLRLRILWLLYLIGWSCLLVLSVSKTSIALALGVPMLFYTLVFLSMCLGTGVAPAATLLVFVLLAVTGACYAIFDTTLPDLVHLVWYDATFTGRAQLWNFMLDAIDRNWITGVGFGSFWGVGSKSPNLYAALDYIRLTNQAHNGYLDVLAALGVFGILLVIGMMAHALRKTEALRFTQPCLFRFIWFIAIFSIIHNTMESSLLVPFSIVWHVTLLTYLVAIWASQEEAS